MMQALQKLWCHHLNHTSVICIALSSCSTCYQPRSAATPSQPWIAVNLPIILGNAYEKVTLHTAGGPKVASCGNGASAAAYLQKPLFTQPCHGPCHTSFSPGEQGTYQLHNLLSPRPKLTVGCTVLFVTLWVTIIQFLSDYVVQHD